MSSNQLFLGTAIREIRIDKKLSNKTVSQRLGIVPSTLSKYESNERKIKAEMLPSIADSLGVTVDFILQKMLTIRQQNKSA